MSDFRRVNGWIIFIEDHSKTHHLGLCTGCNSIKKISKQTLKYNRAKYCRCHGNYHYEQYRKEKRAWVLMRHRCLCKTSADYLRYGGRGISICAEWSSFRGFLASMGPVPFKDATVERIDVNANYESDNCRWATPQEQAYNKRNTIWTQYEGRKIAAAELAKKSLVNSSSFVRRLQAGWDITEALTTPKVTNQFRMPRFS